MTRILIVRACAIGDFVLNIPAIESLYAQRSDAVRFTFVGYPGTLELAREFLPEESIEGIFSLETQPWSRLFAGSMDGPGFDSAIVWMKNPTIAQNLQASGIRDVVRLDPFPVSGHAADHLLQTLGFPAPPLPDKWSPSSNSVVLHPGSGGAQKCWPYFNELADRIAGTWGHGLKPAATERGTSFLPVAAGFSPCPHAPCFLIGPNEEEFKTPYPKLEGLSLRQVAAELRISRAYVGNDSGITHLAAYLGVPAIALFGPTDPQIWGPRGRRVQIVSKASLAGISVEDVLQYVAW